MDTDDGSSGDGATMEAGLVHWLQRRLHLPESRRTRILVVAIVILLVLSATVGVALMGDDGGGPVPSPYVDVTTLEPFDASGSEEVYLEEGQAGGSISLMAFFYLLELPQEAGQVSICFIDHISVRVSWMDEPDEMGYVWGYENTPDTVRLIMTDREGWFDFSEEATNVHGGEAEIGFDWEGNGTFFATALDFDGEHSYSGVDGWEYIGVDNESVAWTNGVNDRILLVDAGDQYHERLPLSQVDGGNSVKYEVTISGYFERFGP